VLTTFVSRAVHLPQLHLNTTWTYVKSVMKKVREVYFMRFVVGMNSTKIVNSFVLLFASWHVAATRRKVPHHNSHVVRSCAYADLRAIIVDKKIVARINVQVPNPVRLLLDVIVNQILDTVYLCGIFCGNILPGLNSVPILFFSHEMQKPG
jgi:hypothetical protein